MKKAEAQKRNMNNGMTLLSEIKKTRLIELPKRNKNKLLFFFILIKHYNNLKNSKVKFTNVK